MESDEITLNQFEKAVLRRMADQVPTLSSVVSELALSRRELTGVGSFTKFAYHQVEVFDKGDSPLALDVHILMPGVENGLGALLFFDANSISFL